ncbi:DNA-processing protein DprA [Paraglaciecola aquimarina]|uniref:DNA-processing protein DprA n=1 Tax=Paraglaciecola aquimarina TaxID=1235557 RepID=A0ABU3T0H6_9ALTE|nr:DNA-processing protein DprA [Paraglaciecola aquimarina]MDU0355769.1 DNA-processing protein DprA [Paraglaciecola aquimarina]
MTSENTKTILLLTSYFNSNEVGSFKVLSINEYGYLACWLHQNNFKPIDLLDDIKFDSIFEMWDKALSHVSAKKIVDFSRLDNTIANITYERIKGLVARGASLSMALDKWQSAGVWIIDRQHPHYPQAFKKHLKHRSPALLFGVGNSELLAQKSIGFVGSRDCQLSDEQATNHYVEIINSLGYQVVSGAAKGVDSQSMLASLNNDNNAIGVVADGLFKASASKNWRQPLKDNRLVLISPFFPEGRFTPANAMARNKYIYLLSQATIVVTSGEKGGTWEGAIENLKKDWVPLFVSAHQTPLQAGNQALIDGVSLPTGAASANTITLNDSPETLNQSILEQKKGTGTGTGTPKVSTEISTVQTQSDLFSNDDMVEECTHIKSKKGEDLSDRDTKTEEQVVTPKALEDKEQQSVEMPLLNQFYTQLCELISQQSNKIVSKSLLESYFPEFEIISKTALDKWLKHLVEQNKITNPNARKKEYGLPSQIDAKNRLKD